MKTFARLSTLLLVGFAAACSESTVGPDEAEFDFAGDVALIVADAVVEDLAIMGTAVPGGLFASSSERSTTRTRTFFDAGGAEMDGYDPELTASITTVTETVGSASRSELELTLARSRTMTASGLAGEETERTFNGSGTDDRSRVRTNDDIGTRTYVLSGTHTTTDVIRSVNREANPWPLSGTIARSINVEITNGPNGDETRSTNAVLTFNGTQFAELNVDGEIFEVDLSKRGRSSVNRR